MTWNPYIRILLTHSPAQPGAISLVVRSVEFQEGQSDIQRDLEVSVEQ